jgi:beta-galactosidase
VSTPSSSYPAPTGLLYGAAYYAEYQLSDRVDDDLDLMAAAGFTVIRVGESVWSTWEPTDGVFDLEWLLPVLDGAHARGISVILGTPTYAVPPWLQTAHPEIAADRATGSPMPWGARQEVDYSHPTFLKFAERIIRKVVARYADHPAVIGFQVDNEPGMELFHNPLTFARFVERLREARSCSFRTLVADADYSAALASGEALVFEPEPEEDEEEERRARARRAAEAAEEETDEDPTLA